jgi:hypothetical protein
MAEARDRRLTRAANAQERVGPQAHGRGGAHRQRAELHDRQTWRHGEAYGRLRGHPPDPCIRRGHAVRGAGTVPPTAPPSPPLSQAHPLRLPHRPCCSLRLGGQVSRLQVAQLCAAALRTPEASRSKVLEVVAEEGAPAVPLAELMRPIAAQVEGGPPPPQGSPAAYQRKYRHTRSATEKWLDIMSFAGCVRGERERERERERGPIQR